MKLRFSIRDLLWLTLVIGLILGWALDHQKLSSRFDILRYVRVASIRDSIERADFIAKEMQIELWNQGIISSCGGNIDVQCISVPPENKAAALKILQRGFDQYEQVSIGD